MKVLLVKPASEPLVEYTTKLDSYGITYELFSYPIDSTGLEDESFREVFAEKMYQLYGPTVDAIQFFPAKWKNPKGRRLRGLMFNRFYSGYLLSYTKMRKGYEDTAIHELLHKVDNWAYVYLGIKLETIVGVLDWDEGVVHAEAPGYIEYEYEEVWKQVMPYVMKALIKKRQIPLLGYLEAFLIQLRETLRNMQATKIEIQDIDHPVPGYGVSYKYGVPDENYTVSGHHIGTDYLTSVGTPVKAPIAGEIVVSGNSKTLGNFCHFKYLYAGKTYTARFLHLQNIPKQGKYQKGQIMAYTGNTGFTTGPHLHAEVWHDDIRLDLINRLNWQELTLDPQTHFTA